MFKKSQIVFPKIILIQKALGGKTKEERFMGQYINTLYSIKRNGEKVLTLSGCVSNNPLL